MSGTTASLCQYDDYTMFFFGAGRIARAVSPRAASGGQHVRQGFLLALLDLGSRLLFCFGTEWMCLGKIVNTLIEIRSSCQGPRSYCVSMMIIRRFFGAGRIARVLLYPHGVGSSSGARSSISVSGGLVCCIRVETWCTCAWPT